MNLSTIFSIMQLVSEANSGKKNISFNKEGLSISKNGKTKTFNPSSIDEIVERMNSEHKENTDEREKDLEVKSTMAKNNQLIKISKTEQKLNNLKYNNYENESEGTAVRIILVLLVIGLLSIYYFAMN